MKYCESCGWDSDDIRTCKKCRIEYCPDCESPSNENLCLDCFDEQDQEQERIENNLKRDGKTE